MYREIKVVHGKYAVVEEVDKVVRTVSVHKTMVAAKAALDALEMKGMVQETMDGVEDVSESFEDDDLDVE